MEDDTCNTLLYVIEKHIENNNLKVNRLEGFL